MAPIAAIEMIDATSAYSIAVPAFEQRIILANARIRSLPVND